VTAPRVKKREPIRRAEKSLGTTRDSFVSLHNGLGKSLNGQDRHAEAERAVERWVSLAQGGQAPPVRGQMAGL
jgi:hypothetical protein